MYQRYTKATPRRSSKRARTLLWLAMMALIALCIALLIGYTNARTVGLSTRGALVDKAVNEVSQARNRAYSLSQTGGSATTSMLALIRQHVYSVRVLNELCSSIYGSGNILLDEAMVNLCIEKVDLCEKNLGSGLSITESYTELRDSVDQLYQSAELLKASN